MRARTRIVTRTITVAPSDLAPPIPVDAEQSLAAGTTSATVTWTDATAPAGTTYAVTVTDEAGAAVTPASGSGLGPWVFPTANAKSYIPTIASTATDGQTAQSSALVAVAAAVSGAGWDVALDLDLTGLDAATLADDTTTVVTRSAVAVATVWASETSNSGTVVAGATGLRVDGGSATGSVSALIDLAAAASLTLPDDIMSGVAIDIYMTTLDDWTAAGTAWRAGISDELIRFSLGGSSTVQGRLTGSNQDRRIATNESFTTWASNEALPATAWVVTLRVDSGSVVWAWYSLGADAVSDAYLDSLTDAVLLGSTVTADVTSAPAGTRYGALLYGGVMAQLNAAFTLTRMRVRTRRV